MTTKLHPLVKEAKIILSKIQVDENGILNTRRYEVLNVRVSKKLVPRAIKILNQVVKEAEKRFYNVGLFHRSWNGKYDSYIQQGENKVEFIIEEPLERHQHIKTADELKYGWGPQYDFVPSGKLVLKMENVFYQKVQQRFADNSRGMVEDKTPDFFDNLEKLFQDLETERLKSLEAEKARRLRYQEEVEAEKIRQESRAKIEKLESDALKYDKAQKVRAFADYLRSKDIVSDEQKEQMLLAEEYLEGWR